jgi:hypothetical protein
LWRACCSPSLHALPPVATVQADLGRFVAEEKVFVMDGVWELSITLSGDRGKETITVSMLVVMGWNISQVTEATREGPRLASAT